MKFNKKQVKNLFWVVPAVVAFLIALIPTLKHQWPLTVDIFYHIHVAQVYSQYGLTLTDPFIDPGLRHKIGYMPLFSLVIIFLGTLLRTDYFTVARILQPFLAFSVVLSVSYVAKKFYGDVAGISAGFFVMSSYLFSRLISPLPETMALIFIPLAVYFYYKSFEDKKYLYAVLSGFMFLIVLATHQAATMILLLIMTTIAVVMMLVRRNIRFLTSYLAFLVVPAGFGLLAFAVVFLVAPSFASNILNQGLTSVTGLITSLPYSDPISNLKYVVYIGILLLFAIIGAACSLRKRRNQDIIIFIWIIVVFLISKAYWFGINVYTIRLLVYILLPLSILAGFGLSYIYKDFKKNEFPYPRIRSGFLIATFIVAAMFALTTVEDPNLGVLPKYTNTLDFKTPQIAPPTSSDVDLVGWFKKNGDKKFTVISNNYYTTQFLLATTMQPVGSSQTSETCIWSSFNKTELNNMGIGYFVYDKRLIYSKNSTEIIGTGLFMFNMQRLIPTDARLLYENNDYKVFKL